MGHNPVVIDTNVIIAAMRSRRGASALLLSMLADGRFEAHLSIPLALEYEDVLMRQRVELRLSGTLPARNVLAFASSIPGHFCAKSE